MTMSTLRRTRTASIRLGTPLGPAAYGSNDSVLMPKM